MNHTSAASKKVFIAPLDWGLGHATRMVPVIEYYQSAGWEVILGGEGQSALWLKKRFPQLRFLPLPSYKVRYSKSLPFVFQMIRSLPKIALSIQRERKKVQRYHGQYQFDLILSDNRYGVRVKGVKSYIFSHQINIRFAFAQAQIFKIQKAFFRRFTGVLVPDFPLHPNLAGELSALTPKQQLSVPLYYLGALSRFSAVHYTQREKKYKYVAVVSGPAPHKELFVEQLCEAFSKVKEQTIIITYGLERPRDLSPQVNFVVAPSDELFLQLVQESECLISRSGYSTLMDLLYLNIPAVLVPTPGQTEQEYLAKYWGDQGWAQWFFQEDFAVDLINPPALNLPFGHSSLAVHLERIS